MNLLPIVIAFLLLMSALSFSELLLLKRRAKTGYETLHLIEFEIRHAINKASEKRYDDSQVKSETTWERSKRINAISKINLSIFLEGFSRTDESEALFAITSNLMEILYSERLFYQQAKAENPQLREEILEALIQTLRERSSSGENFTKAKEIANLSLSDPSLEATYAEMLGEVLNPNSKNPKQPHFETLVDYVTFSKEARPLRLWLASPNLLRAIYGQESADLLLKERQKLYLEMKKEKKDNETIDAASYSARFEQLFLRALPESMPLKLFNFEVSLSAPTLDP